ncbi:MBOAT family O-acyltransferase [Pedobacter sp. B4-66]|uniref:MBOAT family O-acyltransferase n=1 Tax=Pedobacter sp. B4-66 TaxID=2817280 RepID=UPI001BDA6989|nr:MBOAT family O-acyltransferase [Pedobacter sp. B4-66]
MLFNSFAFAVFLPVVFILYWLVARGNLRFQNILLLVSSYFFYACWDYRFLFLLIFSTLLDYFSGIKIEAAKTKGAKKFWLWLSIGVNLGFLSAFKYFNFFAASFAEMMGGMGLKMDMWTLKIILPVGISFYTFHGLSYVIDIYKDRIKPERDFINYSVFVSFFPLLVAGPIERARHLLPQIIKKRAFNYTKAIDGLRQILWGLFKKIVIADSCAEVVNQIFNNPGEQSGSTLALGAVLFAFQIYGDFSGYSDIALGTARLFGIELLRNFAFPYFSRDIAEFWRRWHISLSSWFKDYLYIPLGGSKGSTWKKVRNVFIIFIVSGFWHGANWTFIIWGLLNALYILPSVLIKTNRNNLGIVAKGRLLPTIREFGLICMTFGLTVIAWIFFRSKSVGAALNYVSGIFSESLFTVPSILPLITLFLITVFVVIEWIGREDQYALQNFGFKWARPVRWSFYFANVWMILFFSGNQHEFIYFQF